MAKVIELSEKKCIVIEAKNIGFLKAVKDIGSAELEGIEELAQETIIDARDAVPAGFEVVSVETQVLADGKNIFVSIFAEKK